MKEKVERLIAEGIEGTDLFVVGLTVSPSNDIKVLLDSDSALTLADCKKVSRAIEFNLDREETDFSLTVASAGIGEPLVLRQYKKNVGRYLKVKFNERQEEGMLMKVEAKYLVLSVPNKKKSAPNTELEIQFADIAEAKVAIRFK